MAKLRRTTVAVLLVVAGAWLVAGSALSSASTTFHNRIRENETTHKYHYTPLSMTIHKGDTITWTDKSDAPHTITFGSGFDKMVQPGHSVSRTFRKAGTFRYHCKIHSYMHGSVTVH